MLAPLKKICHQNAFVVTAALRPSSAFVIISQERLPAAARNRRRSARELGAKTLFVTQETQPEPMEFDRHCRQTNALDRLFVSAAPLQCERAAAWDEVESK